MERLTISPHLANRIAPGSVTPRSKGAKSVIYVMTRDQRVIDNYGLAIAQEYALQLRLPLIVVFCLLPGVKSRAREHFDYMLQGLQEVASQLQENNISFVPLFGKHGITIAEFAKTTKPAIIVTDFSPLRGARGWQEKLAKQLPLIVVDSHNCVPIWIASQKQEFSARTLRPKIHALMDDFIIPLEMHPHSHPHAWSGQLLPAIVEVNEKIEDIRSGYVANNSVILFDAGETAAHKQLNSFIKYRLNGYGTQRNDPNVDGLSGMSPYLHFGSIGSMTIVRSLRQASIVSLQPDIDAFIEELVIRKELSDNFCYYNQSYDSLAGAPQWAQDTLLKHANDQREYIYTKEQFEQAATHDPAWNAAQTQLLTTGKMHGYMRMYWAKKILEWSENPTKALATTLYLNDFYSIDGGDPNGYVGALWSIAGLHDRPWGERPIYGTVRSMVYNGLKRKFDIEAYIQKYEP